MHLKCWGKYNDFVKEANPGCLFQSAKERVHDPLKSGRGIAQPQCQDLEVIEPVWRNKTYISFVFLVNWQLPISGRHSIDENTIPHKQCQEHRQD